MPRPAGIRPSSTTPMEPLRKRGRDGVGVLATRVDVQLSNARRHLVISTRGSRRSLTNRNPPSRPSLARRQASPFARAAEKCQRNTHSISFFLRSAHFFMDASVCEEAWRDSVNINTARRDREGGGLRRRRVTALEGSDMGRVSRGRGVEGGERQAVKRG